MTIEISKNALYIIIAIIVTLIIILVIYLIRRTKSNSAIESDSARIQGKSALPKKKTHKEITRRKEAARRIEAKIQEDLKSQTELFNRYISNLKSSIKEVEKKIFFKVNQYSTTNPSGLFNTLRHSFNIAKGDTVYYCRRNSSTFGSDDYFIITYRGFSFGDSHVEEWNLEFEDLTQVQDLGVDVISFDGKEELDWKYVLRYNTTKERADFIEYTNSFLKAYRTKDKILIDAALNAADEKAIPLLENLTNRLGTDTLWKKFVRASYHYVLAEDGVDVPSNTEQCYYAINDIRTEIQNISKNESSSVKKSVLSGYCGILEAKIMSLKGEDSETIKQNLKEYMGNNYPEIVRDIANRLYSRIN